MRPWNPTRPCLAPYRSGFTLLELMAVLVIIAILMVVFVPKLLKASEAGEEAQTRTWMQNLQAAIIEYENQMGDYPPSQFQDKWGTAPNNTNVGAETLFLSLFSPDFTSSGVPEDALVNTDADESRKPYSRLPKPALFELRDNAKWENPIAYFHHRDYGRADRYVTVDGTTGDPLEATVSARKSPVTGGWFNPTKFQLISAGLDGEFGTEDDIGNWEKPKD